MVNFYKTKIYYAGSANCVKALCPYYEEEKQIDSAELTLYQQESFLI